MIQLKNVSAETASHCVAACHVIHVLMATLVHANLQGGLSNNLVLKL